MVPSPWKPLVDTWSSRPFMPTNPREAILTGKFSKVPLLTGVCSEEGIMMVSHIVREPERWSLLAEVDWWKHILEIGFHIHPEDATEENKRMMLDICKDYGMQIKFRFFNGCIVKKDLIPNSSDKRLLPDRYFSFWPQLEVVFLKNASREGGLLIDHILGIIPKAFDCDYLLPANSSKSEKKELLSKMIDMFTDAYFKVGTLDTAQLISSKDVPVFQYR